MASPPTTHALSLSHTHTHTHTHTRVRAHTHIYPVPSPHTRTRTHACIHHTHPTCTLTSQTLTCTLAHTLTYTRAHVYALSPSRYTVSRLLTRPGALRGPLVQRQQTQLWEKQVDPGQGGAALTQSGLAPQGRRTGHSVRPPACSPGLGLLTPLLFEKEPET